MIKSTNVPAAPGAGVSASSSPHHKHYKSFIEFVSGVLKVENTPKLLARIKCPVVNL